jgi:hypothetical protein
MVFVITTAYVDIQDVTLLKLEIARVYAEGVEGFDNSFECDKLDFPYPG